MFKLISLGFLIWAFFNPLYASIAFIILFILIEGWFLFLDITKNPNLSYIQEEYRLTNDELKTYKKYYVFFTVPMISSKTSQTISGFGLSVIIWIPLLLYNWLWIPAIIIGLNLFLTFYLSRKLNPLHFANYKGGRGKILSEKRNIKLVHNKINWRKSILNQKTSDTIEDTNYIRKTNREDDLPF